MMKLVSPRVEYLPQDEGLEGVFKQIELAGRVCYKSEDKITENSAKKFVEMLIKRKHLSPLEHGTIYLKIPTEDYKVCKFYEENPYSYVYDKEDYIIVTTNYRVIIENKREDDLKYFTVTHCPLPLGNRLTYRIICSRSIANELVRHRVASFSQESTRYCNYKNKGLEFIKPHWWDNRDNHYLKGLFASAYEDAGNYYLDALKEGTKPELARELLPLGLKTELIMTAFKYDWWDIIKLRIAPSAHPDMRVIIDKIESTL